MQIQAAIMRPIGRGKIRVGLLEHLGWSPARHGRTGKLFFAGNAGHIDQPEAGRIDTHEFSLPATNQSQPLGVVHHRGFLSIANPHGQTFGGAAASRPQAAAEETAHVGLRPGRVDAVFFVKGTVTFSVSRRASKTAARQSAPGRNRPKPIAISSLPTEHSLRRSKESR